MFSTETLHEIFLKRDIENRSRIAAIETKILQLETQIELLIKLLRESK